MLSLYVSEVDDAEDLVPLLELVAEDLAPELIAGDGWLLHPYDGGMDVISDSARRLRQLFSDWLSARPDGL